MYRQMKEPTTNKKKAKKKYLAELHTQCETDMYLHEQETLAVLQTIFR